MNPKKIALVILALLAAAAAQAQEWPNKPVRVIVPSPPGTAPDIAARLLGDKLSQAWKQQMVVENRPGAGSIPGMSAFIKTAPDGYNFAIVAATAITLTPHLFKNPQYSIDTDVTPVAIVATGPFIVAVNPSIGVNSLADLIALAKAQPGKVNFAPPLLNTTPHLAGELLAGLAGIKFTAVPYSGTVPAVTATMTNESQVTIDGVPALATQIKAGKLKGIAVTSKERIPGFDLPPVADTFKGFEAIGWFAVLAPAKTPAAMVERMNRDVNAAIQLPDIVARFADLGIYPRAGNNVQQAAEFIASERKLWSKVVKDLNIQPQ